MKQAMLLLLLSCTACAKPVNPSNRYPATALLNDSTWFGNAQAVKLRPVKDDPCATQDRFFLLIRTDLPYERIPDKERFTPTTGCLGECRASQQPSFYNIPLKRGKYKIADLNKCVTFTNGTDPYTLTGYAGGVYVSYAPTGKATNRIKITRYSRESNLIEGRFKLTLTKNSKTETSLVNAGPDRAHFRKGKFTTHLKSTLDLN